MAIVVIILIFLNLGDLIISTNTRHVHFHTIIDTKETVFVHQIHQEPSSSLHAQYEITFREDQCCPLLLLYPRLEFGNDALLNRGCWLSHTVPLIDLVSFSKIFILLKPDAPNTHCERSGGSIVCAASWNMIMAVKEPWYIMIGYECGQTKDLTTMMVSMQIELNSPLQCEHVRMENECFQAFNYSHVRFPNLLGHKSERRAAWTMVGIHHFKNCYQHAYLFLCRILFMECRNGELYLPCRRMCEEGLEACATELSLFGKIDDYCETHIDSQDPNVCIDLPIRCPSLSAPEFGSVNFTGHGLHDVYVFECDDGYQLSGSSHRFCLHSGQWNGSESTCVNMEDAWEPEVTVTILIWILLQVFVILVLAYVFFKRQILLVSVYSYIGGRFMEAPPDGANRIYLSSSDGDMDEVRDNILPAMRRNLGQAWRIINRVEDFLPGDNPIDFLHDAVWQSGAVVILLTNNFIRCCECQNDFTEALTRHGQQSAFRVIVIKYVTDGAVNNIQVEHLPDFLRIYVETRVYLRYGERLFWNKLRRAISE